jgi:hypothetical protein
MLGFIVALTCCSAGAHEFVIGCDNSVRLWTEGKEARTLYVGDPVEGYFPSVEPTPTISPGKHFVAFLVRPRDPKQDEASGQFGYRQDLIVVDMQGHTMLRVEDTFDFSWSPDGNAIVYLCDSDIRTKYVEYGRVGTGAFIYDFPSKQRKQISKTPSEVHWAKFDKRIYIVCGEVEQRVGVCNPQTGRITPTDYQNLHFSPDGDFYFDYPVVPGPSRLFGRTDNTDVTAQFFPEKRLDNLQIYRWLGSTHLLALEQDGKCHAQYIILDLRERKIRAIAGDILAFIEGSKEVVLGKPGVGVERIVPIDALPIRTKEQEAVFVQGER